MQFEDLGLSSEILKVLKKKGFEEPTPIQEQTIPKLLQGERDIIAQAQTGTGKTAAFGLPLIELFKNKTKHVQALILTPTRELAIQVAEEIYSLKGKKHINVIPIYGGQAISLQLRHLKKGVDIVVGTPGRVIDHLKRKSLNLSQIDYLVLDEADEMLNMGFLEEVNEILEKTNPDKRIMLFSATMPKSVMKIAERYMGKYDIVKTSHGQLTVNRTDQIYFEVSETDKFEALCRIIDIEEDFYGVVFCRTKMDVDRLNHHLQERGYQSDALHGDIVQKIRERILNKFKKRNANILVATDVAARGIDVQDISHVINYSLPHDPEAYVHRIGRTGRAGKEGIAITFVTSAEYRKLQFIQNRAKADIRREKLPNVKDIIKQKRQRIRNELNGIIDANIQSEYLEMAHELTTGNSAENIIAALLQQTFSDELNPDKYKKIDDIERLAVDKKGTTRLFVKMGKRDGLSRKKLTKIIQDNCQIKNTKIRNVEILDKFSFITLPFKEAEMVLSYFKRKSSKRGMHISKAKAGKKKK